MQKMRGKGGMKLAEWLMFGMIILGLVVTYALFMEAKDLRKWASACKEIEKQEDFCRNADILCNLNLKPTY